MIPHLLVAMLGALPLTAQTRDQPADESRVEALTEEDRGETRLPEDAWMTEFQGLYAEGGACGDHDATWAFAPGSVEMGRTICTRLGKMTWEEASDGPGLVVPMAECRFMGDPVHDLTVVLAREGEAVLATLGEETRRLEPCPPPGE